MGGNTHRIIKILPDRLAEALFSYQYDQLSKPMATVIKHLEIVLNAAENEQSNGPDH